MRSYLLVFDDSQISREVVIAKIDSISEIQNWYAFFGNTFCIASEQDARRLAQIIRTELPSIRFLIFEVDPDRKGGWLPKSLWEFINDPRPASSSRV